MGIKERRIREKLQIKKAIVDAALTLARESGWQSVTMRKIAERIEYSPPMIYEHFKNKDDLLFEIMRKGFVDLHQVMESVIEINEISGTTVMNLVEVYWDYSMSNKELYQVMYELGGVSFGTEETPQDIKDVFIFLKNIISSLPQFKGATDQDLTDVTDILWGSMHGILALTLYARIAGGEERGRYLFKKSVRDILKLSEP